MEIRASRSGLGPSTVALLLLAALARPAGADDGVWALDADGNWATPANWTSNPAIPNGIDQSATFGNIITANRTVSLDAPITLGSLTFDSPFAYTLAGTNPLTFQTTTGPASLTSTTAGFATTYPTLSAPLTLASNLLVTTNGLAQPVLSGTITGTGTLTKQGSGTLAITGANAGWSGNIYVNEGTLSTRLPAGSTFSVVQALGTGTTTVAAGATLDIGGIASSSSTPTAAKAFGGNLNLSGSGVGGTGALLYNRGYPGWITGTVTLSGGTSIAVTNNYSGILHIGDPTGTVPGGTLTGTGGLTKIGGDTGKSSTAGILQINVLATYTGGTSVQGGVLAVGSRGSLVGTGAVTVYPTAALSVAKPVGTDPTLASVNPNSVTLQGGGLILAADLDPASFLSSSSSGGALTYAATNTHDLDLATLFGGNPAASLQLGPGATVTLSGTIRASINTTLELAAVPRASGKLTISSDLLAANHIAGIHVTGSSHALSGNNDFAGPVTIDGGILTAASANALGAAGSTITVNPTGTLALASSQSSHVLQFHGGTLRLDADVDLSGFTVPAGTTGVLGFGTSITRNINLSNIASTVTALAAYQTATVSGALSAATDTVLTLQSPLDPYVYPAPKLTISSNLLAVNHIVGVHVTGGEHHLSGVNTMTSPIVIDGGTLWADSTSALGSSTVTVNRGGTLDVNAPIANPVRLSGGTLVTSSQVICPIEVAATSTVNNASFAGPLTGSAGLLLSGSVTYNTAAAYTGPTRLDGANSSVLTVGTNGSLAGAGDTLVPAGGVLAITKGAGTDPGLASVAVNSVVLVGGTLALSAATADPTGALSPDSTSGYLRADATITSAVNLSALGGATSQIRLVNLSSKVFAGPISFNTPSTLHLGSGATISSSLTSANNILNVEAFTNDANAMNLNAANTFTGSLTVTRGTLYLAAANTYAGPTVLASGAHLVLRRYATILNTSSIDLGYDSFLYIGNGESGGAIVTTDDGVTTFGLVNSPIVSHGGLVEFDAPSNQSAEILPSITFAPGRTRVEAIGYYSYGTSTTLTIASHQREPGAAVSFILPYQNARFVLSSRQLSNGVLVDPSGVGFASYASAIASCDANGVVTAVTPTSSDINTATATDNVACTTASLASDRAINSLTQTSGALDLNGHALRVGTGAVYFNQIAATGGGTLVAPRELVLWSTGTSSSLAAAITDDGVNSVAVTFASISGGSCVLSGANTFSGPLTISGVTVNATAGSVPYVDVTCLAGAFYLTSPNTICSIRSLTLAGSSSAGVSVVSTSAINANSYDLRGGRLESITGAGPLTKSTSDDAQLKFSTLGYAGNITIDGGLLKILNLPNTTTPGTITVNAGGILSNGLSYTYPLSSIANPIILNGGMLAGSNATSSFAFSGTLNVTSDSQISASNHPVTAAGNPSDLTLSGPLAIAANTTLTKSGPGTVTISGPQSHGPNSTLRVIEGPLTLKSDGGPNLTLQVAAAGQVTIGGPQHLAAVALGRNTTLTFATTNQVLVTSALSLALNASLDLAANHLIVQVPPTGDVNATYATLLPQVQTGAHAGLWDSSYGITSSVAATSAFVSALAMVKNADLIALGQGLTTFRGEPADDHSIFVAYTLNGDTNLDGVVDLTDYQSIDAAYTYNLAHPSTPKTGWLNGDFNYDGRIDSQDYFLIDRAFFATNPLAIANLSTVFPAAAPEPASLALLALGLPVLLRRRPR